MEPTPRQQRQFMVPPGSGYGTFSFDQVLPKLPVPTLEQTLEKYLLSVQPFVTVEEFERTKENCRKFGNDPDVLKLQQELIKRSQEKENWLSDWWLEYAYLTYREPLIPCLNVSGPFALTNAGPDQLWPVPVDQGTSLKYASQFVYHLLQFWKCLREETLKPDVARDGTRFNMHQFRKLFNSTRIPQKDKDWILSLWVPRREGNSPRHIAVLRRGHVFTMEVLVGEEPWTPLELESAFKNVCLEAEKLGDGPGIAALTRDPRDTWSDNREYLKKLDPTNSKSLETIETAMFVVVLDEEEPRSESEVSQKLMTGLPVNRWADKSLSLIQFSNGHGGVNCDHSPIDAMVTVVMSYFIHLGVTDMKAKWTGSHQIRLLDAIDSAKRRSVEVTNDIVLKRRPFTRFGKNEIQKLKVNPDTFVQMALQLAYYRLHQKPAPTYETATTRKCRLARTETVRSCTNEVVNFVKVFDDPKVDLSMKRNLLKIAMARHNQLMKEAKEGFGCDRHLMGLSILSNLAGQAVSNNSNIRNFYDDPAFSKSGGGGNFYLSTSTSGYTPMSGGASAMVTDGYGVFYNFEPHQTWVWTTNFRRSFVTSAEKFDSSLENAFADMRDVLASGEMSKI